MKRFASLSTQPAEFSATHLHFVGTKELIDRHLPNAIEGRYANGQRYWLQDGRIIFEQNYHHVPNEEAGRIDLSDDSVLCFNTIESDSLYAIRSNGLYLPAFKTSTYTELLYHKTTQGIAEAKAHEEDQKAAICDALRSLGIEPIEETISLYRRIINFDYYYSYIDEASKWRHWNDEEKSLDKAIAGYPALVELKAGFYSQGK